MGRTGTTPPRSREQQAFKIENANHRNDEANREISGTDLRRQQHNKPAFQAEFDSAPSPLPNQAVIPWLVSSTMIHSPGHDTADLNRKECPTCAALETAGIATDERWDIKILGSASGLEVFGLESSPARPRDLRQLSNNPCRGVSKMREKLWDYDAVEPGQSGSPIVVTVTKEDISWYALVAQNISSHFTPSDTCQDQE